MNFHEYINFCKAHDYFITNCGLITFFTVPSLVLNFPTDLYIYLVLFLLFAILLNYLHYKTKDSISGNVLFSYYMFYAIGFIVMLPIIFSVKIILNIFKKRIK